MMLCLIRAEASTFALNGDLSWKITEPRCTFTMVGGIQNTSPTGTSGTIKLVLWATKNPYPSIGSIVAEYTLGQVSAGYQFSDFSVKTSSNVPTVTGDYYFTIAVLEYTTAGWQNRLLVDTGTRNLVSGNFTGQLKWKIPTATVTTPIPSLMVTNQLKLSLKASEYLNLFPTASRTTTTINIDFGTKAFVKTTDVKKTSASFKYVVKKDTLNGKKVNSGSLYLDYANSSTYATITLFFQGPNSGTYKSVETVASKPETTWGTFTFK